LLRYFGATSIGSAGARNGPLAVLVGDFAMYTTVGAYTNPPELEFSANATRRVPGVNEPVAAPN
jgi:hypothetical protein